MNQETEIKHLNFLVCLTIEDRTDLKNFKILTFVEKK
jgi:hypothetical protein